MPVSNAAWWLNVSPEMNPNKTAPVMLTVSVPNGKEPAVAGDRTVDHVSDNRADAADHHHPGPDGNVDRDARAQPDPANHHRGAYTARRPPPR